MPRFRSTACQIAGVQFDINMTFLYMSISHEVLEALEKLKFYFDIFLSFIVYTKALFHKYGGLLFRSIHFIIVPRHCDRPNSKSPTCPEHVLGLRNHIVLQIYLSTVKQSHQSSLCNEQESGYSGFYLDLDLEIQIDLILRSLSNIDLN